MKPPRRKKLQTIELGPDDFGSELTPCQLCGVLVPDATLQLHLALHSAGKLETRGVGKSSLRTFFDARFRARWWVLVPVCWGLLLGAAALTWHFVR